MARRRLVASDAGRNLVLDRRARKKRRTARLVFADLFGRRAWRGVGGIVARVGGRSCVDACDGELRAVPFPAAANASDRWGRAEVAALRWPRTLEARASGSRPAARRAGPH